MDNGRVTVSNLLVLKDRGVINLDGGELAANDILFQDFAERALSPTFNFNSGTLRYSDPQGKTLDAASIDTIFGGSATLASGQHLAVDGVAELDADLRLDGGTLSVGSITPASFANVDFDAGTLNLTNSDLIVISGGLFGDAMTIALPQTVNVSPNPDGNAGAEVIVTNDATLTVVGGLSADTIINDGDVVLVDTTGSGRVLDAAVVNNEGSTLTLVGDTTFTSGVSGPGDVYGPGSAIFAGGLSPGNSPGIVEFESGFELTSSNSLLIELAGTEIGDFDRLVAGGDVVLDGILDVELIEEFEPQAGQTFDILDWGTLSGTFSQVNLPLLSNSLTWDTTELYTDGILAVIGGAGLLGDYNGDGRVDAADYTVWRDSEGATGSGLAADGNGDPSRRPGGLWRMASQLRAHVRQPARQRQQRGSPRTDDVGSRRAGRRRPGAATPQVSPSVTVACVPLPVPLPVVARALVSCQGADHPSPPRNPRTFPVQFPSACPRSQCSHDASRQSRLIRGQHLQLRPPTKKGMTMRLRTNLAARRHNANRIALRQMPNLLVLLFAIALSPGTLAASISYPANFSANQSVWASGPSGGFNRGGTFGGGAGIRWSARANSGTVAARINGQLQVDYPATLDHSSAATITLDYVGGSGSSVSSNFGASVGVNGFIPCIASNPFTGNCLHPRSFDLLDEGFFVDPRVGFTTSLDTRRSSTETDNAVGFGPNLNLIIGSLGAQVNVDVTQSISLTPTGVDGVLRYENRSTGEIGSLPFLIPNNSGIQLNTAALGAGTWDFDILSVDLINSFRNNIDLDLRPTINYVIGSWPPPGSPLFSIGLVDETFGLDFNTHQSLGSFTIEVGLPGDYNGDGRVDAADYGVWRDTIGSLQELAADGDGSGQIDQADYEIWRANFGQTSASLLAADHSGAVPEPSTLAIIGIALCFTARRVNGVRFCRKTK